MQPRIAITKDFLHALESIPKAQRKKTREFLDKFRIDPKAASINYEAIHNMRDDRVRTVRIDQKYRAVVLHPDKGNLYLLLWVDNHDEAMDWARNKTFGVNPQTGAFQIVDTKFVEQTVQLAEEAPMVEQTLFSWIPEADLLRIGLPSVLLPAVRAVKTVDALNELGAHLPEEVYEALYYIAGGDSVQQALAAIQQQQPGAVVVDDIEVALQHPDSLRRVTVIESADDLAAMLDAPLADWRVFLHPDQRALVARHFNGPARVLGGAGTGKTVVALHRAVHLAEQVFTADDERILFTTYTRNLARNIEQNLRHLGPTVADRIEVTNLHSWSHKFLSGHGVHVHIASRDEIAAAWGAAILDAGSAEFDDEFYATEWANVVKSNGLQTKAEYLRVRRRGQHAPLNRKQRLSVWRVFERFQQILGSRVEFNDLNRLALKFIIENGVTLPYRAVVVDEVQDLHPIDLQLLRAMVPETANDMFLVGDAHQRIYSSQPVVMSQLGIAIRGRSRRLRINYRTTERIRNYAVKVLEGFAIDDMDGAADSLTDYRSLRIGNAPNVQRFKSQPDEVIYVLSEIEKLLLDDALSAETICIAARTSYQLKPFAEALTNYAIEHVVLTSQEDDAAVTGVRLATMHRVKGLEFTHMFLVGLNEGVIPSRHVLAVDDEALVERCLFHVAATRARDSLTLSCSAQPSRFVQL